MSFKRLSLSTLDRGAFALWWSVFKLRGALRAASVPWCPHGNERVLALAPHPDDEALGCGGTLVRHLAAGDFVELAVVTDGRRSRAGGLDGDAMAEARRGEACAAARLLGASKLSWLGFREGEWRGEDLDRRLSRLIERSRPQVIYGPCGLDYHPEHRRVAQSLARVVPDDVRIRVYTLHVPLNGLVNVRVDVSAQLPLVEQLFDAYATQRGSLIRGLRLRRYAAASAACGRAVEAFWELSGRAYRKAHPPNMYPLAVRGMRARSFSDPLCFIVGGRARRALARSIVCPAPSSNDNR
jgi:LmbE family N-acetylglucosaminyl deacetylase